MKVKQKHPLISCICISQNRPQQLLRAIVNFEQQSYPNKELVVSYPSKDLPTKKLLERILKISHLKMVLLGRESHGTLGQIRNQAVMAAHGSFICTWDDDDWYHPERLKLQMSQLQNSTSKYQACILQEIILYDRPNESAYLSATYNWSGTLLCKKDLVIKYPYQHTNRVEDGPLIAHLEAKKLLLAITGAYYLYVYIYHGTNVIDGIHFNYFTRNGPQLDHNTTQNIIQNVEASFELD
ncbi:glycosyltransferase family A protein [Pedobacter gandavensis]|uniref:glycosyltransferase family 2 protein n=1 Tax=Pedobacter gandavensis TaxID=2679963 RepID=UPI00292DCD77|nr:glycosyltransferase family A protein [Pedobacter gandavensis]